MIPDTLDASRVHAHEIPVARSGERLSRSCCAPILLLLAVLGWAAIVAAVNSIVTGWR